MQLPGMIILIFALAACAHTSDNRDGKTEVSKTEIKIDVTNDEKYIISAIWEFNKNSPVNKIKYDTVVCDEEYKTKYAAKLFAGEGSDIIRIGTGAFSAFHKAADSGVLYDLNNMIIKDKNFKLSDYNQKAMAGGVINGKRLFIPIQYDFPILYAKKGTLKENGIIPSSSDWTLKYLAEKASEFSHKNKNNGKTFLLSNKFTLSYIVKCSGLNFINYEKKEAGFDSAEFIDLLNIYKKMYPAVKNSSYSIGCTCLNDGDIMRFDVQCPEFDNGSALLMDSTFVAGWHKCIMNSKDEVFLLPQYTNKKSILIEPVVSLAINSKSIHKNEAYEFIKLLLSEEYQTGKKERYLINIPVNNNAYLNSANFNIRNLDAQTADGADIEKMRSQLKEIEKISRCDTTDMQVYEIIDAEAKSFINGKNTAERTAKIIQDKVMLYLNE